MEININTSHKVPVLEVIGRIDTLTSPEFQTGIVGQIEGGHATIICDLSNCDYISSAGLRVFLIAQKKATPQQGKVVLSGMSGELRSLFELSGFTAFFTIVDTVEEGLSSV